jgi:pantoate kinase
VTERAYAPGSVTTLFAPPGEAAAVDGGRGVSFATAAGVEAAVALADRTTVRVDGDPRSFEPVERALEALGVAAAVSLSPAVPIGYGFGASGAATLATVLAVDAAAGLDRDREALVEVAARAERAAGTGVGDVYVQDRGGLVWNVGEGSGRATPDARVEYAALGELATADLLGDAAAMDRVRETGARAMTEFDPAAPLADLFALSWTFAGRAGLPTDRVAATVARVEAAGGAGTMALFGETVVAAGVSGTLPNATRVTADGAHLL